MHEQSTNHISLIKQA